MVFKLLISFLQIGFFAVGGGYAVIPLIQELVVQEAGWISQREFTDIITLSQMTPGPLAVNTSTFVGLRIAGIPGAVVATFGCVFSGFVVSLVLYRFFVSRSENALLGNMLSGLKAASVGLIAAAAAGILATALWMEGM